jgi:hypothetical protein
MISEMQAMVDEFMYFYGQFKVVRPYHETLKLRQELLDEEMEELLNAGDDVDILDALVDIVYIILGTITELGFEDIDQDQELDMDIFYLYSQIKEVSSRETLYDYLSMMVYSAILIAKEELGADFFGAFKEVHRSNMSKLGEDGTPVLREDGKVLKGPNYSPPNLKQFL